MPAGELEALRRISYANRGRSDNAAAGKPVALSCGDGHAIATLVFRGVERAVGAGDEIVRQLAGW